MQQQSIIDETAYIAYEGQGVLPIDNNQQEDKKKHQINNEDEE